MGRADRRTRARGRPSWLRRKDPRRLHAGDGRRRRDRLGRPIVEAPFGHALAALGAERPDIVGLTADLGKYTDILPFRDALPGALLQLSAWPSRTSSPPPPAWRAPAHAPFATTYGVFASRRAYDYRRHRAAPIPNLPVKIVAGLPGLTTGYGGTHQAIEDTGLMSLHPGLVVIDPCDATEIAAATRRAPNIRARSICGCLRGKVPVVLRAGRLPRSRSARRGCCAEGGDVGFIATGFMTERALDAAARLRSAGHPQPVCCMCPTLKPFDAEAVADFASGCGRLVTAENHVVRGGLASPRRRGAASRRGIVRQVRRIGLPDRYIECGAVPTLQKRYRASPPTISSPRREERP